MLKVYLTNRAEKDIKHLPIEYREKVKNALRVLSEEPLKGESLLGTFKGFRRYRIGDFRIVYEIDPNLKHVLIVKIKHRKEVYR